MEHTKKEKLFTFFGCYMRFVGEQDNSASKSVCHQTWKPKVSAWNLHGYTKELTLESCLLICTHVHTSNNYQSVKLKAIKEKYTKYWGKLSSLTFIIDSKIKGPAQDLSCESKCPKWNWISWFQILCQVLFGKFRNSQNPMVCSSQLSCFSVSLFVISQGCPYETKEVTEMCTSNKDGHPGPLTPSLCPCLISALQSSEHALFAWA